MSKFSLVLYLFSSFFPLSASDCFGYHVSLIRRYASIYGIRSRVCVRREREARVSATTRAKGIERTRAIDKTPNAARPRLIPQAYTHPLVFSLSSPTTHPLDHYPLSPPPPPPPPPPLSSSVPAPLFRLPATLRKSPSYPLRASPSPNATHPLRESPRTLEAADIRFSLFHSAYLFISLLLYAFPRRSLLALVVS